MSHVHARDPFCLRVFAATICRDSSPANSSNKGHFRRFPYHPALCSGAQGRRLCGTTWVTPIFDVTQNLYSKRLWEAQVDAFAARCTRQPSCGRLSKRGLPTQASAVRSVSDVSPEFIIGSMYWMVSHRRVEPARTYQTLLILSRLGPGC
jgi:hypothetical protein